MLLPALYEGLATRSRKHTLVFAGFAAEEQGMLGSKAYAKSLSPEQREKTHAMVNLDTLGLSPSAVWLSQADPRLAEALAGVAESMKLPLNATDVDKIGRTDSNSFIDIGVPAITIHSITQETLGYLHTRWDQLDKIQLVDYVQTFYLVTVDLAYLDASWEAGQNAGNGAGENTPTASKP
jgi:Zn-dependent M28 family amino/carboxypeptidase